MPGGRISELSTWFFEDRKEGDEEIRSAGTEGSDLLGTTTNLPGEGGSPGRWSVFDCPREWSSRAGVARKETGIPRKAGGVRCASWLPAVRGGVS